ncbi:hypothetical protein GCM10011414_19070 [Croceivirga lutea]|uniref:DUF1643 domain-containing protein n=1 Tax=Croceivirga lutea TaxID=1775167 RepID=UPI00163A96D5|nr:DUF1643 domain-containing protein [Croceivirga lutea]GGG49449.1 hypothetical protein GCM10011414_19070 [Croceivirga lutea]
MNFDTPKGAILSDCKKYRFLLWRTWNVTLPKVLFIGLNPSKANAVNDDPTTKKIGLIAKHNNYGGFIIGNCFPRIATKPAELKNLERLSENDKWLTIAKNYAVDVVFVWGNFSLVYEQQRNRKLKSLFPNANVLAYNKSGSPKHPLYIKANSSLIPFKAKYEN